MDLYFLNEDEQALCELIPFVWSKDKKERMSELGEIGEEVLRLILSTRDPKLQIFGVKKLNSMIHQAPYQDVREHFREVGMKVTSQLSLVNLLKENI